MRTNRLTVYSAIAATVVAVAVIGGTLGFLAMRQGQEGAGGHPANLGGPFTLTDHDGATITEADLEGHPSALFFGFTHCPEVCPTTIADIDWWTQQMGEDADGIEFYFVSIDPERDTPEILGEYLNAQTDRVTGISGTPEEVWEMARSWRVYWNKVPLEDGGYTMDHSSMIYLLDEEADYAGSISYGAEDEEAMAALERLAAGS
ncbi:SCO family protein [Roseicyclus sp. F158]|uniref:SCO family protein n=1 Tax=Tropicimonas omnivorans TaxID=3075590 RepID=A0ABU3DKL8_9RHOB|nr:SCO family protein [Roseicyclus sp. F158]MDT0684260.1 SCO family protein [Roseicyclus sp. F158]